MYITECSWKTDGYFHCLLNEEPLCEGDEYGDECADDEDAVTNTKYYLIAMDRDFTKRYIAPVL